MQSIMKSVLVLLIVWISIGQREITSYHAVTRECDNECDIGAFGRIAVAGHPTGFWCAANFLPRGTRIIIPKITGIIRWTVRDRTAEKCGHRVDLLFPLNEPGIGLRKAEVFVVNGK